jgi:hypothetical protein
MQRHTGEKEKAMQEWLGIDFYESVSPRVSQHYYPTRTLSEPLSQSSSN